VKTGYFRTHVKPQFKESARYIAEGEGKYPESLIIGYSWSEYMFNYYFERIGSDLRVDTIFGEKKDIDKLQDLVEEWEPEYFWYVFAHREPDKEFLEFLNKTYYMKETKKLTGAGVFLYKVN